MSNLFDRSKLQLLPLHMREHDFGIKSISNLEEVSDVDPGLEKVAHHICEAKKNGASVVFMMGAHVIRSGVQKCIIELLDRKFIDCICVNGAATIHDFELSLIGATTESVQKYISDGQFGLWQETARINDIVNNGAQEGMGLGEAVGRYIHENEFPYKEYSLFAAAFRNQIPITVHVGIGYDITHEMPNFSGAAYGEASYRDFLRLCSVIENLQGGVVMNFGSAVMAPEIFLKALSMGRNAARKDGKTIKNFTTLVCDLVDLPSQIDEEADKTDHKYFFRPWKTMLVRTVKDGGRSYYVKGFHQQTIPQLYTAVKNHALEENQWVG